MGLFSGFFAILAALDGNFILAVYCIIIAMLLDALDGRVARMTGTESEFGKEFDSLADMVSFGVSPGQKVPFLRFESSEIKPYPKLLHFHQL